MTAHDTQSETSRGFSAGRVRLSRIDQLTRSGAQQRQPPSYDSCMATDRTTHDDVRMDARSTLRVDGHPIDPTRLREVCHRYGVIELAVFGSVARGEATGSSDVDLLYVLAPGARLGFALNPELLSVVERARTLARERGELVDGPSASPTGDLSPAARGALADWVASGDYDRAVAEITANDPDLATQ